MWCLRFGTGRFKVLIFDVELLSIGDKVGAQK